MGFEVRGIFLDISKDFDITWHDGMIFMLHYKMVSKVNRLF